MALTALTSTLRKIRQHFVYIYMGTIYLLHYDGIYLVHRMDGHVLTLIRGRPLPGHHSPLDAAHGISFGISAGRVGSDRAGSDEQCAPLGRATALLGQSVP